MLHAHGKQLSPWGKLYCVNLVPLEDASLMVSFHDHTPDGPAAIVFMFTERHGHPMLEKEYFVKDGDPIEYERHLDGFDIPKEELIFLRNAAAKHAAEGILVTKPEIMIETDENFQPALDIVKMALGQIELLEQRGGDTSDLRPVLEDLQGRLNNPVNSIQLALLSASIVAQKERILG